MASPVSSYREAAIIVSESIVASGFEVTTTPFSMQFRVLVHLSSSLATMPIYGSGSSSTKDVESLITPLASPPPVSTRFSCRSWSFIAIVVFLLLEVSVIVAMATNWVAVTLETSSVGTVTVEIAPARGLTMCTSTCKPRTLSGLRSVELVSTL